MSLNTGNSVVAFYAAESGVEKSLYRLKYARQNNSYRSFSELDGTHDDIDSDRSFDIIQATTSTTQFIAYDLTTSTPARVSIMDPLGYIAPIDWGDSSVPTAYGYNISWSINKCFPDHASDRLEITTTAFENIVFGGGNSRFDSITDKQVLICNCAYDTNNCNNTVSFYNLVDTKYYNFSFRPLDSNVSKLVFNLTENGTDIGILSETSIVVDGNYRNSRYRLKANMSSVAPVDSIFNYVIFSEQAITKGY